jgi:hypothetical protein
MGYVLSVTWLCVQVPDEKSPNSFLGAMLFEEMRDRRNTPPMNRNNGANGGYFVCPASSDPGQTSHRVVMSADIVSWEVSRLPTPT